MLFNDVQVKAKTQRRQYTHSTLLIIKTQYDALLSQAFTDRDGDSRPITEDNTLVAFVANPKLLEIPCSTVKQIKLVNTLCWLDEYAQAPN